MACKEVPSVCCMVSLQITTIFGGAGGREGGGGGGGAGQEGRGSFWSFLSCNLPCVVFFVCCSKDLWWAVLLLNAYRVF